MSIPGHLSYSIFQRRAPTSFLFCVVAKTGPHGVHRPLAVAQHCGRFNEDFPMRLAGTNLLRGCLRVIAAFSDPANARAAQMEVALADRFYSDGAGQRLDRTVALSPTELELRAADEIALSDFFNLLNSTSDTIPENNFEFPFVSSCLAATLSYDADEDLKFGIQAWPLGAMYDHNSFGQALVVFDITDSKNIAYGIHAFDTCRMGWIADDPPFGWDPVEDEPPINPTDAMLDPGIVIDRVPLTAKYYLQKHHYYHEKKEAQLLAEFERIPVVEESSADYIWPVQTLTSSSAKSAFAQADAVHPANFGNLKDIAIAKLLSSVSSLEVLDMTSFDWVRRVPDFQQRLLKQLRADPTQLGPSIASAQLLALAYAREEHLDWAQYNISFEGIRHILTDTSLQEARSLSLCFPALDATPADLLSLILSTPAMTEGNLKALSLFERPERTNDDSSLQFLVALIRASEISVNAHRLLNSSLLLTGLLSNPMRNKALPLPPLPLNCFPVRHMLFRYQTDAETFKYSHCHLGELLLHPVRIVAGLLKYFSKRVQRSFDECKLSFCEGYYCHRIDQSRLSYFQQPVALEGAYPLRAHVVPAVVELEDCSSTGLEDGVRASSRCVSSCSDLREAESWTIVVSHEIAIDRSVPVRSSGVRMWQRPITRYAFVRAASLEREDDASSPSFPMNDGAQDGGFSREDFDICTDMLGFLENTEPPIAPEMKTDIDARLGSYGNALVAIDADDALVLLNNFGKSCSPYLGRGGGGMRSKRAPRMC